MSHTFEAGDVLYIEDAEAHLFYAYKIVRIESWETDEDTWHVRSYYPLGHRPTVADLPALSVQSPHISMSPFPELAHFLAHQVVEPAELQGFLDYLKQTQFHRYLTETGQDLDTVIQQAIAHYQQAYDLTDQGHIPGAIAAYDQAIATFPMLYEAMDNQGLLYMDLQDYEAAIDRFTASLAIAPDGFRAIVSIAECYFQLREYAMAEGYFEAALELEPKSAIALEGVRKCQQAKALED